MRPASSWCAGYCWGFSGIDLFVDETQYWLWGQDFAWGYYSKPPLIAWLIGAVTTLAGSDAPFWVRMPAPLLNGATAVLLAALSARVWGPRSAIWVAAAWLSLPAVALGSILISTDTVMAPLFAAALLVHHRLCETRRARDALLVGVLIGLALLAKYAAVYFLIGAGLAALLFPGARIGWRNAGLMLLALAIVVAPNLLWNLQNGLVTLRHTADNIGWVENGIDADRLPGLAGLVIFLASQLAVMGPVLFGAFVIALARFRSSGPLAAFALVPLAAVSVQSLLDTAYANWAVAAYFAGTPLAMAVLARYPRLRIAGLTVNVAIALIVHLLAVWPQITLWQADPPLERYVGRAALSQELIALAKQDGDAPDLCREPGYCRRPVLCRARQRAHLLCAACQRSPDGLLPAEPSPAPDHHRAAAGGPQPAHLLSRSRPARSGGTGRRRLRRQGIDGAPHRRRLPRATLAGSAARRQVGAGARHGIAEAQLIERALDLGMGVRLFEVAGAERQIRRLAGTRPRYDDDLDGGPATAHHLGQLSAVDRPRHIVLDEGHDDTRTPLEMRYRLIGAEGDQRFEPRRFEQLHCPKHDHGFVLDDEDQWPAASG